MKLHPLHAGLAASLLIASASQDPYAMGRLGFTNGRDILDGHPPAQTVTLRAEQLGDLEDGRGTDDRRGQQKRKPRGVFVREASEQPAAHRRTGTREARDQCESLRCTNEYCPTPGHLPRDPRIVVGVSLWCSTA